MEKFVDPHSGIYKTLFKGIADKSAQVGAVRRDASGPKRALKRVHLFLSGIFDPGKTRLIRVGKICLGNGIRRGK